MNYRDVIPAGALGESATSGMALLAELSRKSPEQQRLVREHLGRFATANEALARRLEEFVTAFPFHPDALGIASLICAEQPGAEVRVLSRTLAAQLDSPIPATEPGLIDCASLWTQLVAAPEFASTVEVETIARAVNALNQVVEPAITEPERRHDAHRLARALGVFRLAAPLRDGKQVVPVAELSETLLLPAAEELLRAIHAADRGQYLEFDSGKGHCRLRLVEFKRFVRPEVLLHWVNAVPFLLLMLTGGINMASRFWHIGPDVLSTTRLIHLTFAVTWLIGLPLVVLLWFKVHWGNIRSMLGWKRADFVWLVQSIRSLINRKATLSPVGRFNAGQKINGCLVMVYFVGFGGSGALMFFKESVLSPWYVHASLFFATLASVGGHLYLSLLHPSTRKSLPGIFRGWTPMDYVEHHHPLSLPPSLRDLAEEQSPRGLWEELMLARAEFITLLAVIVMAGVGVYAFQRSQIATIKKSFARNFDELITPAQLSTKHNIGPTLESCVKCHDYGGEIPDANCVQCHLDIQERLATKLGYHGTLKGDCRTCHLEHPTVATNSLVALDRKKFDHNLAAYQLTGKHATLACDECHLKKHVPKSEGFTVTNGIYFIGVQFNSCTDCHRDVHNGKLAANCEKCHSTEGWTGKNLKFSHDTDSTYPLVGKHKTTECAKCHQPPTAGAALGTAPFKGIAHECLSCHKDPHRGELPTTCTPCHTPSGWRKENLTFDHNKNSKYPLEGKHAAVSCEKCHTPAKPGDALGLAKFRGLPMASCADCHPDPHRQQFTQACTVCHPSPATWNVTKKQFDHDRDSKFPLTGEHAEARCIKCHKPTPPDTKLGQAKFKELPMGCADCHKIKRPDKHPEAAFGTLCVSCHNTRRWGKTEPPLTHIQNFAPQGDKLVGKHLVVACKDCHQATMIPRLGLKPATADQCAVCHQSTDPHKGTLGRDCFRCHTTVGWKAPDLRFDHDTMTRWALDQDHERVACVKCHENNKWKPLDTACKSCHPGKF